MELTMRFFDTDSPENLPSHIDTLFTGYMGACVSTVVLFNFDTTSGTYKDVRGYHAGGGIDNTNWGGLFAGVPNQRATESDPGTRIYVISGDDNKSLYEQNNIREKIRGAADAHGLHNVKIRVYHMYSGAYIKRSGEVI